MKKAVNWIQAAAILVMVITWGVVGLNIANGDYEAVTPGAYIVFVCLVVNLVCVLYKLFSDKCPHCGKIRTTRGKYCPYCGKEI